MDRLRYLEWIKAVREWQAGMITDSTGDLGGFGRQGGGRKKGACDRILRIIYI
ncbi:MAG: hypothetical protein H0Z33_13800 [Bacillaceae bacterium]|nr:hypothetical protein [Bacillaceae bacterium]